MPTIREAEVLAEIRQQVAEGTGLTIKCADASSIIVRYEELLAAKAAKGGVSVDADDESPILIPTLQIPQQQQLAFL